MDSKGIIAQFKGYFKLKELDWVRYKKKYKDIHRMDRILKAEGKSPDNYKVAKHFTLHITERSFSFARQHESIATEAALDGIYVIRTSLADTTMDSAECAHNYKA